MMLPRPSIKSKDTSGQIEELRTYLYQLIETLEFALDALEDKIEETKRGGK